MASRADPSASPLRAAPELRLVTVDEIRRAAEGLRGVTVRTPLLPFGSPEPGDRYGRTRAWLKPENLQPIGAFKLRGAYTAIASLSPEERRRGVVAHSSGNHAQGVARAARLLGARATIVMPSNAPAGKVAGVRADGAEIVFVGPSGEERAKRADELARTEGWAPIPPFDDARIIAGQGTVGLEIVEQVGELAASEDPAAADGADGAHRPARPGLTVLVPIGGGGLASGVATSVKELLPDARVLGVEPDAAADARESLLRGQIVQWAPERLAQTSADGMRTGVGVLPFAHLRQYLDGIVTVSEIEIARAMARAATHARLVLEPSGATTLAAWLFHRESLADDGPVVCVLSGGNVDPDRYIELVSLGLSAGG